MVAAVIILSLAMMFNALTGRMSETRQADIRMREQVIEARKYGEYNGQTLCGVEVIALIRENAVCRGECVIKVYRDARNLLLNMGESNYAAFTYEALTDKTSSIKIDPGARFSVSVEMESGQKEMTLRPA